MTDTYGELLAKIDLDIEEHERKIEELLAVKEQLFGLGARPKPDQKTTEPPIVMKHEISPEDLIEKHGEIKIDNISVKQRRDLNQDLTREEDRHMLDIEKLQATKPREQVFYSAPQPGVYQQPAQYPQQPAYERYPQQPPQELPPLPPEPPGGYYQPPQQPQPMQQEQVMPVQERNRESGVVRTIKNPWFLIVLIVIILLIVAYLTKTITIA